MSHNCSCTCPYGSGCFTLKKLKPTTGNILKYNTVDGWPPLSAQPTLDNLQGHGLYGSHSTEKSKIIRKTPDRYYYKGILVYPDEWLFDNDVWVQAKNITPALEPFLY